MLHDVKYFFEKTFELQIKSEDSIVNISYFELLNIDQSYDIYPSRKNVGFIESFK